MGEKLVGKVCQRWEVVWGSGGIRGLESADAGTGKIRGDRAERAVESRGRVLDTNSDDWLGTGYPEGDPVGVVFSKAGGGGECENVTIGGKHVRAGVVQCVYGVLEAVAADGLVLEGCVPVSVEVSGVPQRAVTRPKEVDELAGPKVPGEISTVAYEGE